MTAKDGGNPGADGVATAVGVRSSPTVVQALTRDMVRACLEVEEYRFWTDESGDFLVEFSYDDRVEGAMVVFVRLDGPDEQILSVTVECDRRFKPERRGDLLELINAYHREYRWPRVSLWDDDGALRIDCETQVDLSAGVHERLLHELIDAAFAEGDAFWRWLVRRIRGAPVAGDDADDDGSGDGSSPVGDATPDGNGADGLGDVAPDAPS